MERNQGCGRETLWKELSPRAPLQKLLMMPLAALDVKCPPQLDSCKAVRAPFSGLTDAER